MFSYNIWFIAYHCHSRFVCITDTTHNLSQVFPHDLSQVATCINAKCYTFSINTYRKHKSDMFVRDWSILAAPGWCPDSVWLVFELSFIPLRSTLLMFISSQFCCDLQIVIRSIRKYRVFIRIQTYADHFHPLFSTSRPTNYIVLQEPIYIVAILNKNVNKLN